MKKNKSFILSLLFTIILISSAFCQIPGKIQDHPIALIGATIHTISGETIENGIILFDKGIITGIGKNIDIPQKAEQINVKGKHIYPGMIDAYSTIGLIEIGSVKATIDINETGKFNPNVKAEVAINPESEIIPVVRANGITSALIIPGNGLISGTSALIYLDGWTWEEMTFKSPTALHINWPRTGVTRRSIGISEEEQKKERDALLKELIEFFDRSRSYMQARKEMKPDNIYHEYDFRYEAMIPVLERKIPVIIGANDLQQIESAISFSKQENIKIIIAGGRDSWMITELLKEENIPVILYPVLTLPSREWEDYDLPYSIAGKLYKDKVKFCIAAEGSTTNERNLPYHAAMAAAFGLPREEALKSITLYPSQILGVDNKIGSLETGKDATLIITDGDILEIKTNIEKEFIQGKGIDLNNKHKRLYEKYKEKYRRMGLMK